LSRIDYEGIKPYVVNVFGDFAVAQVHVTEVASGGGKIIAESPPSWHRLIKDKLAMPRATTGMAYTIFCASAVSAGASNGRSELE
jgi:hypothetical protein